MARHSFYDVLRINNVFFHGELLLRIYLHVSIRNKQLGCMKK